LDVEWHLPGLDAFHTLSLSGSGQSSSVTWGSVPLFATQVTWNSVAHPGNPSQRNLAPRASSASVRAKLAAVSRSGHGYVSVSIRLDQFVGIGLIISDQLKDFFEEVSKDPEVGVGEFGSVSEDASDVPEPSCEVVVGIHFVLSFWSPTGRPFSSIAGAWKASSQKCVSARHSKEWRAPDLRSLTMRVTRVS